MAAGRILLVALASVSAPGYGPARAEPPEPLRVLELSDDQRWRAVGSMSSTVTGAKIVILREEDTGQSKIARLGDTPLEGVRVLSISPSEVLLEVQGRPARLAVTRGAGSDLQALAAPVEAAVPERKATPRTNTRPGPVRLTLEEFYETAKVLRRALISGDIALGENEDGVFGVMIANAPSGGVIERLGLQRGDVVVAINGTPAANGNAALDLLDTAAPGQRLPFAFRRGRQIGQGVVEIEPSATP